ncbi:MAG: BREX-1 system phosphatase PglZ type A [Brumimicrobium sp.]|nr:BREX-1 system phosphatase PglZ type A [Brumimicrobium sp.]
MSNLKINIEHAFKKHRIVFWYDDGNNNEEEFTSLELNDIEKIKVSGNEFALKYRLLREELATKFLLYFPYKKPNNEENWLLDVELSNKLYESDEASIFLQEMGWEYKYRSLIEEHIEFFKAKDRRKKLVSMFNLNDSFEEIKYKMVAMVFGTESYDLMSLIQVYANSHVIGNIEKFEADLQRYNLFAFLWKEIQDKFNYKGKNTNIYEFIIDVFDKSFALGNKNELHADSRLILSKWRDSITLRDSYVKMSNKAAEVLQVESKLQNTTLDKIENDELFNLTEQKIISVLVEEVGNSTISQERLEAIVKVREFKFWYSDYSDIYKAIESAFMLLKLIRQLQFNYMTVEEAIQGYTNEMYQIDYHYRKFNYHYQSSKHHKIVAKLSEKVEKAYVNDWLFGKGNDFQGLLNAKEKWAFGSLAMQRDFFKKKVLPIIEKQKLFVIISDAFRFECGVELNKTVNQLNKFNAELSYMISALPSYTQLGMASLLPHKTIAFDANTDNILIDGKSASGTNNRSSILSSIGKKTTALLSDEFIRMNSSEKSDFVRDHEVVYLYHNQIDKVGDDKMTERDVFKAAQEEIDYLIDLIKSLTSANASRILITADHGFLFQAGKVDENDFVAPTYTGETFKDNRRFVLGKDILGVKDAMKFSAKDLGIESDVDVLISKGINRFKVKGAGSQFVHGGATLQEIIVPVLDITKGRKDDIRQVDVIVVQGNNKITTNFIPVQFYQTEAVSEKILPRVIKAFILAEDGEVISDQLLFTFDFKSEDNINRTHSHIFQINSQIAHKNKGQNVKLVLQVQIEGTSRWQNFREHDYELNVSFTNDFD